MSEAPAKRPRLTQEERKTRARRRMIRAAIELIAEQGYSKTTLIQVGAKAGYTGGLVSHYFQSKQGLLHELVGHLVSRFHQDQIGPATEDETGFQALVTLSDAYLQEFTMREDRMRALYVLMGEAMGPVPELGPVFAQLDQGLRAMLRSFIVEAIEDGELRADLDPDTEAVVLLGALRGIGFQWLAEPNSFDLDAAAAGIREILARNLVKTPTTD